MKQQNKFKIKLVIWVIAIILSISACGQTEKKEIIIAEQYGLAYAPIQMMKQERILEQALGENYSVKWVKLNNTQAIREAMLAGQLDVGFLGIPPFLLNVDKGMDWKIMTGLCSAPLGLVTTDPAIHSLQDLIGKGKIALPQPGSIQHILLAMAAQKELSDSTIFDNQLVSMKHPDGYLALLSGQEVKAHYTSPPYLFKELDEAGGRLLTTGKQAMGHDFTFIVGVCRPDFYERRSVYDKLQQAIDKSIDRINSRQPEVIQILSESYQLSPEVTTDYIYQRGMVYSNQVVGVEEFQAFMLAQKYIQKESKDLFWE